MGNVVHHQRYKRTPPIDATALNGHQHGLEILQVSTGETRPGPVPAFNVPAQRR